MSKQNIIIVEDEEDIQELIEYNLIKNALTQQFILR